MAAPKASDTAYWLLRLAENPDLRALESVIFETLGKKIPSMSVETRADLAEEQLQEIASKLETIQEEQKQEGMEPTFELSYDAGTPYFKALPNEAIKFLDALSALDDRGFVDFCVDLLTELGGEGLNVDGPSDGGIDFIARKLPMSKYQGEGARRARLFVVGQAKHYQRGTFVTEPELRDFVGGGLKRISDHNDTIAHRGPILAPVLFAFWTTADFNTPAKNYASSLGIWTLNGIALSQLALKTGFKVDENSKISLPARVALP